MLPSTEGNTFDIALYSIARLCHIGLGFLKFSLTLLKSERKIIYAIK